MYRSKVSRRPPIVSVIIPARNEARWIGQIVRAARRITRRTEVVVICNGSRDETALRARQAGALVIQYASPLGYDVARAIGARHARGAILLFVDGDVLLPTSILRQYCRDVWEGNDLVLNAYSGRKTERSIHSTSEAKRVLNALLGRKDLEGSSLTTIPHAMSRKALQVIGIENLMVPPKAHARAILEQLRIKRGSHLNMALYNRRRGRRIQGGVDRVEKLIIGDHGEAIAEIINRRGERGGFSDLARKRSLLLNYLDDPTLLSPYQIRTVHKEPEMVERWRRIALRIGIPETLRIENEQKLSIILSISNEERTIYPLLSRLMLLNPKEVIILENGSHDRTVHRCVQFPVTCYSFPFHLGHDVGRAIGARIATGEVLLFIDGDILFQPSELIPFIHGCYEGADITLNDVNPFYYHSSMIDDVSMAKAFLNRIMAANQFQYASLTAVPHAMSKQMAERIGYEHLAIPPKAQAIALARGAMIQLVKGINVFSSNRLRREHFQEGNVVAQMILGDHLEAVSWLAKHEGIRGRLLDEIRKREYGKTSEVKGGDLA